MGKQVDAREPEKNKINKGVLDRWSRWGFRGPDASKLLNPLQLSCSRLEMMRKTFDPRLVESAPAGLIVRAAPMEVHMMVLVVEDNLHMSELMCQGLRENGYNADTVTTAQEAAETAYVKNYDAIVLDRMLPDGDGLEVCRKLRQKGVKTPILILTALSATEEKVSGLDAGADDYLAKPFAFEEFIARIRALLRRGEASEGTQLRYEDLILDLARRSVVRAGKPISLTNKEFALLEFFIRRKDRVLARTTISDHVWDTDFDPDSNVIDVYVSMLRRKIDKGFSKPLIHTIVGAGYMFSATAPFSAV